MLRLNFCVRDGNRWIPQAIVTGNVGVFVRMNPARFALLIHPSAPSKPHRIKYSPRPDQERFVSLFNYSASSCWLSQTHWLRVSVSAIGSVSHLRKPSGSLHASLFPYSLDQALDLLVSSSSIRYRTSTDDLSTLSSSRGLTSLCCGNSFLQGGFTLRCLQRLSRPHFASQLCHWHDNCCTRGASIPVLSY